MRQYVPSPSPESPDERAILSFIDVSLGYDHDAKISRDPNRFILKSLNFQIAAGSFHFLTGPSGAGKTSLLKMIYLAQNPSAGQILLMGEKINPDDRDQRTRLRRRLGVVFQDFRLLDHLNVFDNAALPLVVTGAKPRDYAGDVTELLTWVGLKNHLHLMPSVLSGGEKQRLAIARAVVHRPILILADEPTGNIDYAMGLRIMRLLIELNRLGATIIFATHDESLIQASGMPVLELRHGNIHKRDLSRDLSARLQPGTAGGPQATETKP